MKDKIVVFYCLSSIICNTGQGFLNILDKSTVEEGEIFTMTCDYLRFDLSNMALQVFYLKLLRKVVNDSEDSALYAFEPTIASEIGRWYKTFPKGRNWEAKAVSGEGSFQDRVQKEKAHLSITVLDAEIADSGSYTCEMEYVTDDWFVTRRSENLTECEDLELTTSKIQRNSADIKDYHHSVLLLLQKVILVVTWFL